jgi:hypothetical protein
MDAVVDEEPELPDAEPESRSDPSRNTTEREVA